MKTTRIAGIHYWSAFQEDRRIDFNGYFWCREQGNVLIDPMPAGAGDREFVAEHGGANAIVVTNTDHWRASSEWAEATGAPILAPAAEREALGDHASEVTSWFVAPGELPAPIGSDARAFPLRGSKSPGEVALFLGPVRAFIFGDAVRSHETGSLRLLPDPKITNRAELEQSLRALRDLHTEALLLGDGDPILWSARSAWLAFLRELATPAGI